MTDTELKAGEISFREGDIFSWRYKPEIEKKIDSVTIAYWCKSRIAIYSDGVLYDTYWSSPREGRLDPDRVLLTFSGNARDMTAIPASERVFYRSEDIVDTRHANDRGAPVYIKPGCTRNAEWMRAHYESTMERERSAISFAQRRIDECVDHLKNIERGDLTIHFPVYSR